MKVPGLLTVLAFLALAGCSDDTVLFSGMTEQHSNSVIAKLAQEHIAARKQMEKAGVTVIVANRDVNRAVRVLDAAGLPNQTRASLGEIFKKEGVISTPLEERARYIYALSQELESTLSRLTGSSWLVCMSSCRSASHRASRFSRLPPRYSSSMQRLRWIRTVSAGVFNRWLPAAFQG